MHIYIHIHCAAIPDPSPFPFRSLQCGPSALIALWSLGIYATALAARLSTTAAKSAHAFTGMNISRSALGGSSTASLPRKSNFWSLRSCALTNSSMHDGLCVPGMRQFLARPRRQLYWVGICGTCHDDIAAAYHSCCVKASEDEQDALLLVGYTYGSLHGTRDCQALMARSYDNGNPFQIIREDSKYHFGSSPTYDRPMLAPLDRGMLS